MCLQTLTHIQLKNRIRFVESSFRQKVRSTFPIAQYRIASPYQNGAIVVCLRKTNTNSFRISSKMATIDEFVLKNIGL
jgi:hypothetical protein